MANIAVICPPLPGHLNPMASLGRGLKRRGHSVTAFNIPALEQTVMSQGLAFHPLGGHGADFLARGVALMAQQRGFTSLRFAVECSRRVSELLCEQLPAALTNADIDLVMVDQNEPAGGTVAQHLGLPFINVCPSLPLNREPDIPAPFFPWQFVPSRASRFRNRIEHGVADWLISPINHTINRYRAAWGLWPLRSPDDSFSDLAQLCQMTADVDFPRKQLPSCFHYLGPFCSGPEKTIPFPFEQLNGKPLIYASLGTLQERDSRYFAIIAEACAGMEAQLVISLGGREANAEMQLAGSPLIVKYAPQLEILARASVTITHAGLNTVMQSLMFGVPMVAMPITHDQPAIAARIRRSGAGDLIPIRDLTAPRLRAALDRIMNDPRYRMRAKEISISIQAAGGVERAVAIIEEVLARNGCSKNALRHAAAFPLAEGKDHNRAIPLANT
jgi:zeaxanthin glucosyltransferase